MIVHFRNYDLKIPTSKCSKTHNARYKTQLCWISTKFLWMQKQWLDCACFENDQEGALADLRQAHYFSIICKSCPSIYIAPQWITLEVTLNLMSRFHKAEVFFLVLLWNIQGYYNEGPKHFFQIKSVPQSEQVMLCLKFEILVT